MTSADTRIRRVTTLAGDPAWLVTRYDDVKALLADQRLGRSHPDPTHAPRVSGSAIFGGPTGDDPAAEDADRVRMRRLLAPVFSARRMAARCARGSRRSSTSCWTHMFARTPPVDLHEAVFCPLPALVISELLVPGRTPTATTSAAGLTTRPTWSTPTAPSSGCSPCGSATVGWSRPSAPS